MSRMIDSKGSSLHFWNKAAYYDYDELDKAGKIGWFIASWWSE